MINFIRGFLFLPRSIYGKPVTAGSVNLTGIEKYTKKCWHSPWKSAIILKNRIFNKPGGLKYVRI